MLTQPDPDWLVSRVADSQQRFDATLEAVTEPQLRQPSSLPGWTRAHVLAHIAGNATAMAEMFEGYARDEDVAQYGGSASRREIEIEADSALPAAALVELVRDTGARCLAAFRAMPDWDGTLRWQSGRRQVTGGPVSRWREIEIHRVDLDLGYRPQDWPAEFVEFQLARELPRLPERAPGLPVPQLPPAELLGWLFGRSDAGLPDLPVWG